MRKVATKERYSTISFQKCKTPCKVYDPIQKAFAYRLDSDKQVKSFWLNVPLQQGEAIEEKTAWHPNEPFMTDFLIEYIDGKKAVREAVSRKQLQRVSVLDRLDFSCLYWAANGVVDWGLVVECQKHGEK